MFKEVKTVTLSKSQWKLIVDSLKYDADNYQDKQLVQECREIIKHIENTTPRYIHAQGV